MKEFRMKIGLRIAGLCGLVAGTGYGLGQAILMSKTCDSKSPIECDSDTQRPPVICTEVPLSDKQVEELQELADLFSAYGPHPCIPYDIDIVNGQEYTAWVSDNYSKAKLGNASVKLGSASFTHNFFPGQGNWVAYHELAHLALLVLEYRDPSLYRKAEQIHAHASLATLDGFLTNRMFNHLFDEPEYVPRPDIDPNRPVSRPYDNVSELFASAMSVFRFSPDEFARRYLEMKQTAGTEAAVAREMGIVVLDLLQGINPDEPKLMRKILPSYDKIRGLLEEGL